MAFDINYNQGWGNNGSGVPNDPYTLWTANGSTLGGLCVIEFQVNGSNGTIFFDFYGYNWGQTYGDTWEIYLSDIPSPNPGFPAPNSLLIYSSPVPPNQPGSSVSEWNTSTLGFLIQDGQYVYIKTTYTQNDPNGPQTNGSIYFDPTSTNCFVGWENGTSASIGGYPSGASISTSRGHYFTSGSISILGGLYPSPNSYSMSFFNNNGSVWTTYGLQVGDSITITDFAINTGGFLDISGTYYVSGLFLLNGTDGYVQLACQAQPSTPISLKILQQPQFSTSGSVLSIQPVVGIVDQYENLLTTYSTDVEATLVVLSGSATLTGTTLVSTVDGIATFTDLVITGNGLFYIHFESKILLINPADSNQMYPQPDPGNPNPPIPVKPKRSYIAGSVPAYTDLEINEFAINVADRKGYMRDSNDIVHLLFDGYATGGGGSGGTVYSVGVSSQDLTVTNSPITSTGFIGLELNTQSITAGAYGDGSNVAEVTVNDKGIVTGIQNVAISYPVNSITAGTDISLTGTAPDYTINNTAPDQIVSLTSGAGISVSGTYPDFTIDSTITQYTDSDARKSLSAGTGISYDNTTGVISNDSPDQVVSLTGGTDISVTGTYPNFTIDYTGTSGSGTVTSVGISTTASALTITNTPITTSGDIGVNFSGKGSEYVTGDGSLKTFPTTIDQALNLVTEIYNSTGATLTKGTVVYINGGQGNLPTVTKAQANNDTNSAQTYGIIQSNTSDQSNGYVVVSGRLTDIDTQSYSAGTQLYLSPTTAGAWTTTKPAAPSHLVYVGIVVRSHPTQGVVEVKIQNGYELDEIHDVSITSVAPNNILRYNSTTKLWENVAGTTSSISEGTNLYYTDARARASVSAGTGISYSSSTGVITNSSPDQTITLTAGTGISVTGTYPSFTITNSSPSSGGTVTSVGLSAPTGMKVTNSPITGSGTISLSMDTGYALPTSASQTNWDTAYTNRITSLTTTGSSGSATLVSNTLNVPTYTLAGLGGIKLTDLSSTATGLTYTNTTGVFSFTAGYSIPTTSSQTNWDTAYTNRITSLTTTGSSGSATLTSNTLNVPTYTLAGLGGQASSTNLTSLSGLTYVSASFVKMTASGTFSLDTSTYLTANQTITLSGDVTGSGSTAITTTLATVGATKGGTGQTTYTLGDTLYSSASNTLAKLSGNTTTTRKFLRQTGTGTVSAAPAWDTVTKTDVGLSSVENTALSTWAGSSNITTVGTLSALTVSGTTVINSLTYPSTDGTSGQVLSTNGTGTLSWTTAGGASAAGSTGDIQYNDGSGNFTATSNFSYGSSAYDALALYSANGAVGVFGIFAANGQTYPLLELRDYLGTTVYSYFDATGNLYLNAQADVRFADADSSNYAAIQAPATISTNYTLTLPTTAGTNNYVLKTNGSGTLSWANAITNLIGGNSTTLLGSMPYQSNTDTTTLLSPNTTTTKKYLSQTGTGTNGAAPAWSQPAVTEISASTAGGAVYSTASALAVTAAGTSGQILRSNGSSAPTWEAQGFFSGGRLTLTSNTPIPTSDVTAATTIYYTPYAGDKISLYDGTNWATYTFTQLSLSLGTLTSGKNYDVFVYNNAGTLTLELSAAWTSDTARSDALTLTNGVYVKSSATTRRYLGTFRTTSTTTTEDSITKRFVWNFHNRVEKPLYKNGTTSHTYTTASWRNWNNDATLRVEFVIGIDAAQVIHFGSTCTGATSDVGAGFDGASPGYDSINAGGTGFSQIRSGRAYSSRGFYLGYHYCQMQEYGSSGTTFLDARLEGTIWN